MLLAEALEMTRIPHIAGLPSGRPAVVTTLPLQVTQHTVADVGMIGSGQRPMAGKVSLAHHGVLFLDALPRSSTISSTHNGASVLDFTRLAILAAPAAWIAGIGARHVSHNWASYEFY